MVDSRLAFDITARSNAEGVFEKVARAADRTGDSMKKTSKISDDVARSSANLTKARNAETTALDKVQIAEQRLSEVRGNSNSKSSQILAAEKALSKARRDSAVASNVAQKAAKDLGAAVEAEASRASKALEKEGKKAGKGFGASLKKWLTGSGGMGDAGKAGGTVFGSGFLGVIKTPILGPAVVGAITAAVVTVMPAVGAVAAGGLVAGFGAGLGALGIVFAAKSVAVKNAWNRSLWAMAADMKVISKPFERTLIDMAAFARRTFVKLTPALAASFQDLAPSLAKFGDNLGRAFEKLGPSIRPLSAAFQSVLKSLGPAMQDAMGSFSHGLQTISASVAKNPAALSDLVTGTGRLFDTLSSGIATLNDVNDAFRVLPGGASAVTRTMNTLSFAVSAALFPFKELEFALNSVNALSHSLTIKPDGFSAASAAANQTVKNLQAVRDAAGGAGAGINGVAAAAGKSAHETHAANVAAYLLATAYDRQWAATQKANEALTRMSGLLLTLSGSEIAFQQAIDDASASIKENGKTHDINTAKGRANKTALDQVAASANAQTIAMRNAGDGNVSAAKHGESARASFVKLATQMGYTVPQARAMAKSMVDIPNVTRTAKLQANKKDLEAKLAAARTALADKNLTKTREAKLKAEISNAKAGIATINGMLGNLPPSRTVTITTKLITERIAKTVSGATGGHVPGEPRATGGPVTKGQPYIVGEKQPELFVPNVSGTIIPKVPSAGVGGSIASGMAQGVLGGAGSAYAAAAQVAAGMIAKAKSALGISSPSKAFAQLGLYINQGLASGLLGSSKQVTSVMQSVISKVLSISFTFADTKKSIQKSIATYNTAIAAARKRVKPIDSGMSKSEVASARKYNAAVAASIKSLQGKLAAAKKDLGSLMAIGSRIDTAKERNAVIGMLNRQNKKMQIYAVAKAKVAAQLTAAQAKLAAAIEVRDEFRKAITDSAMAFNSIANIQAPEGEKLTASGIIAQMTETLRRTQAFAANLARLKAKGLNATVYKQIAEAGVDQGGAIADALLGGNANTFNSINRIQSNINSAAAGLGQTAADNLYKAGVDAAQGLVNGLLAKTKALDAASKKLAAAIVAQIKKTLGIRSPSKVLAWHGAMAGQGFAQGILGEYGAVQKAGQGLGNAALPDVRQWKGGPSSSSNGGGTVQQPIVVQLVLDGRVVQQALLKLKSRNGNVSLGFE